jgi:ribose-phosphate pyrophosphokinase
MPTKLNPFPRKDMPSHHIKPFHKTWKYPGGEVGVRILEESLGNSPTGIMHRVQNSDDLVSLLMLVNASKHSGSRIREVFIPYLPYARQDRIALPGDPQALEVLTDLLQSQGILDVASCDVHSDKAHEFFSAANIRLASIGQLMYSSQFCRLRLPTKRLCIVIPDKGAKAKSLELYDAMKLAHGAENTALVYMDKVRDPDTGKLIKFEITGDSVASLDSEFAFIIADDICDGGGTFLGVIKAVKERYGNRPSYLFTTHGIYSQGLDKLKTEFDLIGSTDSFLHNLTDERLVTIPCI